MGENDPSLPFDEQLRGATLTYWSRFIDARHEAITEAKSELSRFMDPDTKTATYPPPLTRWRPPRCSWTQSRPTFA